MPELPPVPSVIKIQQVISYAAQHTCYVGAFWRYTGSGPSSSDANNLAGAIANAYVSHMAPMFGPGVNLINTFVTDLSSAGAAQGEAAVLGAGGRAGANLTANDCAVAHMLIARRYRGGKPRQYWPAGTDADLANPSHWTAGFVGAMNNAITDYHTALTGLTWPTGSLSQPVNVSYYKGFHVVTDPVTGRARNVNELRPTPVVDPITGHTVNTRIGTQRRRQET